VAEGKHEQRDGPEQQGREKEDTLLSTSISTPARVGPIKAEPLKTMDCSEIAFIRSSFGTRSGMSEERVGWSKLSTVPEQKARSTIIQT